jgi:Ca2+-binding EF-hand superfamily protein
MIHRLGLFPRTETDLQTEGTLSKQIAALFEAADKDKNGSVSFEEFISLLPRCLISKRRQRSTRSLLPKEKGR